MRWELKGSGNKLGTDTSLYPFDSSRRNLIVNIIGIYFWLLQLICYIHIYINFDFWRFRKISSHIIIINKIEF